MGSIQDQIGRTVTMDRSSRRIVSLVPSQTELLFDLGVWDRGVGITEFCNRPRVECGFKFKVGGPKQDFAGIDRIHMVAKGGFMVNSRNKNQPVSCEAIPPELVDLIRFALSQGAADAEIIASADIVVEDRLAALCVTPGCRNYGHSPSCPPHVSGPSGFRELQRQMPLAVVIRLVVPLAALFSSEKRELGEFLHQLTAAVEVRAVSMGYEGSMAFAGGSCKEIFCRNYPECRRLSGGPCRHPESARPSMSGFGINVPELMKSCGWPADLSRSEVPAAADSMSWLAGLVLIGNYCLP